jgi:hypothetical protein
MLQIIKYACKSLRQMAGRGTEIDWSLGQSSPACFSQLGREEFWWEGWQQRFPWTSLED